MLIDRLTGNVITRYKWVGNPTESREPCNFGHSLNRLDLDDLM